MKFQIAKLVVQRCEFPDRIVGCESREQAIDRESQGSGDHGVAWRITAGETANDVVGEEIEIGRASCRERV
jgi:hypothetical protein